MKIRVKLTIQFACIVSLVLIFFSCTIYYLSSIYREREFFFRLKDKAITTARLFSKDVKEVGPDLLRIIERNSSDTLANEKIFVFSADNRLLFKTNENSEMKLSNELKTQVFKDREVFKETETNETTAILFKGTQDTYIVVATAYDKFGRNKLSFLKYILILGVLITIIIIVVLGFLYSKQALRPISAMLTEVDDITANNLGVKINEGNRTDEIAQLAIRFNDMLQRLELAFRMQRDFVLNASHELRTPLTLLTSQLEVSLMDKKLPGETRDLLGKFLSDVKNLNLLSNGLLDLTQADQDASEIKFARLRIDELIGQARAETIKRNERYKVFVTFREIPDDENELVIMGNDSLLKSALVNVMENGCKYSSAHEVLVTVISAVNGVIIEVADNGIGIAEADLEKIFEPFFRSECAKAIPGYGIGLALTNKIIKLHDGDIKMISKIDQGTTVRMYLKRRIN